VQKAGWVVRSVILYSDSLFPGGSHVVHPEKSSNEVTVSLSKE
jgi:hypothetical protein